MNNRKAPPPGETVATYSGEYVDIDLWVLLRYAAESWRFILACGALAILVTAFALRAATPSYEANMIVAPVEGGLSEGSSSSFTSRVLSSLSFGGGAGTGGQQFDEFQYKLTSPSVVRAANRDGKLYSWLYGSEWNPQTRTFRKPSGLGQFLRAAIRRFFHRPEWYPPDEVLTSETLSKKVLIEALPKSTLMRISYENADPVIATSVLRRLFAEADRDLRNAQRARLKAQIANANEMLAATQVADYRAAMAQVLASSQYRLMNVPDNIDYSAQNVEVPFVSPVPVSPKPALTLAIVAVVTVMVASFMAIGYRILRVGYDQRHAEMPVIDALLRRARTIRSRQRKQPSALR